MELSQKENFGLEKDGENHMNYHTSGISADWQVGMLPATNTSMNPCQVSQMGSSPCPPGSMVDSFCPTLWDHPSNSRSLDFDGTGRMTNNLPIGKPIPGMPWNPLDHISKGGGGGGFPQPTIGSLPPGLSQFPADSAFIERAARFSCFGGGNITGMNPFESTNSYMNAPRSQGICGAVQSHNNDSNMGESSKDAGICAGGMGSNAGSPINSQKDTGNSNGIIDRREPDFSSSNGQEEAPSKGIAAKKRKRTNQEMEIDQAKEEPGQSAGTSKDSNGVRQKDEQNNSTIAVMKNSGKQAKDGSDPPKEDYIHVRARRGQATNSHSLAERVRREKISERMKFLQDLVPGCSKVTGKAVMLDEIINYVQSLQRQVEFLSMKLAAVNPQLDFNIEGPLSKEMLQSRASSSSTIGFSPDLAHAFLHPASQGLVQPGVPGMEPPSDAFRRAINAQLTSMIPYKDAKHQMANSWDDDLHNVLSQMGFGNNVPLNIQESNEKTRDGFPL